MKKMNLQLFGGRGGGSNITSGGSSNKNVNSSRKTAVQMAISLLKSGDTVIPVLMKRNDEYTVASDYDQATYGMSRGWEVVNFSDEELHQIQNQLK